MVLKDLGDETRDGHCSEHKKKAWGSLHICLLRADPSLGCCQSWWQELKGLAGTAWLMQECKRRLLPVCFPEHPSNSLKDSSAGIVPWIRWSSPGWIPAESPHWYFIPLKLFKNLTFYPYQLTFSTTQDLCTFTLTQWAQLQGWLFTWWGCRALWSSLTPCLGTYELHKLKNWNQIFL